jgi:hypothetical protein
MVVNGLMNYYYDDQVHDRQTPGISHIRLFHAVPAAPAVDVYINDKLVAKRLSYGHFTDYIPLASGTYNIEVYPTGQEISPILKISLPLGDRKIYTLAIIGMLPKIGILPIEDGYEPLSPYRTNIRFANLSPNSPGMDLVLRSGLTLFSDINFTEVSDYRPLNSGDYDFFVRPSNTANNILYLPARLLPNRNLTFYLLGDYDQPSTLAVYIPMDGSTYLRY